MDGDVGTVNYVNGKKLIVRSTAKHPGLLSEWTLDDVPALCAFKNDLSNDQPARSAADNIIRCLENGVQPNWIPSEIRGELPIPPRNIEAKKHCNSDEVRYVDFDHPEMCSDCNPLTCSINGESIPVGNWRDLLVTLIEKFLDEQNDKIAELFEKPLHLRRRRPFLLNEKPNGAARQISTGHWVYVNLNIASLVDLIGKLCRHCGVNLIDVEITYTPKLNSGFIYTKSNRSSDSSVLARQHIRATFREWLTKQYPDWSPNTIKMHESDAYYLNNNDRGITLAEALINDDGIQEAYAAIKKYFTFNPTQTNRPAMSAQGYTRSLTMLKDFLSEHFPELLSIDAKEQANVPSNVITVLAEDYTHGFRFDTTAIRLLSDKSGIDIDVAIQNALKRSMFHRNDDVYFLLDTVSEANVREEIVDIADSLLDDYGCFEVSELYNIFHNNLNEKCIRNADDFESLYDFIRKGDIRTVSFYGIRIARPGNVRSVHESLEELISKIIEFIRDEVGGVVSVDDLRVKFRAFSADFLSKVIKDYAEELVKTEINGIGCYQTLDSLGLSDEFEDVLAETLNHLAELDVTPSDEAIHTALSLAMGVNFKAEYNLLDEKTYRRLIAFYYKAEPPREWKGGIFAEVSN
ncbi:hypothetical protein Desdi_0763 [Desulfitobacterium dichloroeliminans LMG P-21439]|uniref:Uncharacterized protein n=1 Tax=Desulfitobacterium dichloroeliminans (strain LMG P-21439 / DCA1) TaxID=871963 RepID=L0F362_DESDL|nr:hypothetical protein [Desulfitobacterium dichloroeliminans]AGA68289.1 hypothetical protein Desdi_0763 [Desulfitobacterium dichloroeliminans LMG P-21439]